MPGTSTIPTIANGPTSTVISISWYDDEDGEYTASFRSDANPTDVALQALVDAGQLASNASSWKLKVENVYEGQKSALSAVSDPYMSVEDKIRLSYKDLSNGAYDQNYLPSPLEALVNPGGTVDTSNATYQAWRDATTALIQSGFTPLNVGFTQYSKRNDTVTP